MNRCVGVWAMLGILSAWAGNSLAEGTPADPLPLKTHSVFQPEALAQHARENASRYAWARKMAKDIVAAAQPWLDPSEDELWDWMFGPHIDRSWMVLSDGYCPACKKDVRMYDWEIDPWTVPWKVRCPHCTARFPKNDFQAYHKSGYNEQGFFEPARADKSLLFNTEHPDAGDPLHTFGVDDGSGYVADGHRWRFIGTYLVHGQWKKLVLSGIVNLSSAYAVTGDPRYARRATILLDRVADVYPGFDFGKQGWVYETQQHTHGQVSTWHDACREDREMALAYDRIFEGARAQGAEISAFLSRKAKEHDLPNSKATWAEIQHNIEANIFADTLAHADRIQSNYPSTEVTLMVIKAVLGWPENREELLNALGAVIDESTKVDGLSGEKGLMGYSTIAPRALADALGLFSRLDPAFLATVYRRHPVLHETYRFHIDAWCLDGQYAPFIGDSGGFGGKSPAYGGLDLTPTPGIGPSMFAFAWNLYELTHDSAFAQVMYLANGSSTAGLPHDLFASDPEGFQAQVQHVIDEVGTTLPQASVNKPRWHLAILRSGAGEDRRALWVGYGSDARHGHADAMNLGLFAKGLDLMPEFGYPPVGYGPWWDENKSDWYQQTAAHVTVTVDGKNQRRDLPGGKTTLWADGRGFHAIRVSAPHLIDGKQYERTVAMADLDEQDSYVFDVFRVVGGSDHANFFHSHFGKLTTQGLDLSPTEDYGFKTEMRHFQHQSDARPGWYADWVIEDRYKCLPPDHQVHLRYTGLTPGVEVCTAEGWIESTLNGSHVEYIPRLMMRHRGEAPLATTFVDVIEPYDMASKLVTIRRTPVEDSNHQPLGDNFVGVEVLRRDGKRDVWLSADGESPVEMHEPASGVEFSGELACLTFGPEGLERAALCGVQWLRAGSVDLRLNAPAEFLELVFTKDGAKSVAGDPAGVRSLVIGGKAVTIHVS